MTPTLMRASVLTVVATLLVACGGDDGGASPETSAPATSSTPSPTTTSSTTTVASTSTTVAETTVPPTTEAEPEPEPDSPVFTTDDLVAAIPSAADVGPPWRGFDGDVPFVDPPAGEGPGVGNCAGPNAMARATPHGVTGAVQSVLVTLDVDERVASSAIYAFVDDAGASAFLQTTSEVVDCPDGVEWERTQRTGGTGADEFDGFAPGFEDVVDGETWSFFESAASGYLDVPDLGADEALVLAIDQDRELVAVGITFGQTRSQVVRYARYGNVVIVTQMGGNHAYRGYLNLDELVEFDPDFDDLDEYTLIVEPLIAERLGLTG